MSPGWIIGGIIICLFDLFLFGDPDASFRSSDGVWRGGEVSFKGRSFNTVVVVFENYKLNCAAENVTLLRTTPMRWYNIFAWPSYRNEEKWRVPYAEPIPEYRSPIGRDHCANSGWPPGRHEEAKARAEEYINQL